MVVVVVVVVVAGVVVVVVVVFASTGLLSHEPLDQTHDEFVPQSLSESH